ncbi:hypothetical protein ONZ45_g7881 [Pleurotus djamor]|nr:hypothetical protein ONZ45_g7881 [Pleurotus djamor]
MNASSSRLSPPPDPPAPPKTPQSQTRISKEATSTPISQGSGTNPDPHLFARQSDFAPYLRHDLRHEKRVSPAEFCRLILNLEIKNSNKINNFEDLRTAYCRQVGREEERYEPFCKYVNAILSRSKSNYTVCRNDPTILWGTNSHRKPDATALHKNSLAPAERSSLDLAQRGPEGSPFHPAELYSFFEFKRIYNQLTPDGRGIGQPQSTSKPLKSKSKSKSKSRSTQVSYGSPSQGGSGSSKRKEPPTSSTSDRRSKRIAAQRKTTFSPVMRPRPAPVPVPVKEEEEPSDAEIDPVIQCASYALEMMSCGLREHVIAFLIEDGTIQLLYYDRSILIRSEPLNFIQDWPMFESLIVHLGQMSAEEWGFRPTLMKVKEGYMTPESLFDRGLRKPEYSAGDSPVENFFEGAILDVEEGWTLELKNIVHQTHGLRGRGTIAIAAERVQESDLPRENVFVKISWQPKSRKSESEFLRHIYKKIEENEDDYKWVLDHLPELKAETSHGDLVGIQARLKAHNNFKDLYEERILRIHVFDMLHKLSEFRSRPVFFIRRFTEIVKCHQWVHDVAGIMHRDVSLNNMMYREMNGQMYGVLNDFDLASLLVDLDKGPQSLQRTGTRIYMAFDLLSSPNPPRHLNRHDLESFFYILLDVIHNPHGQSLNMGTWFALDDLSLSSIKRAACSITSLRDAALSSCAAFVPFLSQIQDLWNQYIMNLRARDRGVELDDVVAGSAITGSSFLSPLDAFLLGRSDD